MLPIRDTIPSHHPPRMTWALIAANVLVYLATAVQPAEELGRLFYLFGFVPARLTHPDWALAVGFPDPGYWSLLTSMFLHGGFLHLLFNLWTLWIFGDNVEDVMGPWRFLGFYLVAGLGAGVVHWLTHLDSQIPTVGASGAIAGVLGAYFILYPRARVLAVFPIFFYPLFLELPAVLYLGFWFLGQLMSGTVALAAGPGVGGVAWWAHIGGFVVGILAYRLFLRPRRWRVLPPDEGRHYVLIEPPPRTRSWW